MKLLVIVLLLLQSGWALAHPPGLSSLDVQLQKNSLKLTTTFSLQDIEAIIPMDSDLDAEVSAQELEAVKPRVSELVSKNLMLTAAGLSLSAEVVGINFDDQNNARIELSYPLSVSQDIAIRSDFLALLPEGHQQFLTAKNADGQVLSEKMLTRTDSSVILPNTVADKAQSSTFFSFFSLGVEHILTGYDHLLFLFALLAVTHRFLSALKIITFFTIAHSITLASAGLNLFDLPSHIVEPLIAATIIYVGLENLVRGDHPKGRHWLTFSFGLIHGFGFAGVLREMDISSGEGGILMPLLSFNLGIETGQITIATIVLPLIWLINNNLRFNYLFLKIVSSLVSLMGLYWFLERTIL